MASAGGHPILAGPTPGAANTGIAIFGAPDKQATRQIMAEDPVISVWHARSELRPFRVSLLRGRDQPSSLAGPPADSRGSTPDPSATGPEHARSGMIG